MLSVGLLAWIAACGGATPEEGAKPTKTPKPAVSVPVFDEDHSMPQPPASAEPNVPDDILIYSPDPLSGAMVEKIRAIQGVAATDLFSLASVPLEGGVYRVAAVNPTTFRRFTDAGKQDAVWSRVAAGEMVVTKQTAQDLEDEENFIAVGVGEDAEDVHIGAYAEPPATIDLVVNSVWGEDLLKVENNALLISTFSRSPQSIEKPLRAIVGKEAEIRMIDAASRAGIDPGRVQTAVPTSGSVGAAIGTYNYRTNGTQVFADSRWVAANIRTENMPLIGNVSCHKAMLPQLRAALNDVIAQGLREKVYQTAGCFNARFIAGSTRLSNHAFGMAIDLNSLENGRGIRGQMDPSVVKIFEKWGFAWGGTWKYTDPMHFELVRLVKVA